MPRPASPGTDKRSSERWHYESGYLGADGQTTRRLRPWPSYDHAGGPIESFGSSEEGIFGPDGVDEIDWQPPAVGWGRSGQPLRERTPERATRRRSHPNTQAKSTKHARTERPNCPEVVNEQFKMVESRSNSREVILEVEQKEEAPTSAQSSSSMYRPPLAMKA